MPTDIEIKKRKMGNNVDFSDDSGIPMDGIEIDSSMADSNASLTNQSSSSSSAAAASSTTTTTSTPTTTTNNNNSAVNNTDTPPRLQALVANGDLVAGDQPIAAPTTATASIAVPLAAANQQQASSNEALASSSPVLSFYEESKGGNHSPDLGDPGLCDQSCNNPSMEDLTDPQPACLLPQQHLAGSKELLQKQQEKQQEKQQIHQHQQQKMAKMMHTIQQRHHPSMLFHDSELGLPVRGFGELFNDDDLD